MIKDFKELEESFKELDALDRTALIMSLGKKLPYMDKTLLKPENFIHGCTSQGWLAVSSSLNEEVRVEATSNSLFVKGMLYILLSYIKGMMPDDVLKIDHKKIMSSIGIENAVTSLRTNGFYGATLLLKKHIKVLAMDSIDKAQQTEILELKTKLLSIESTLKVLQDKMNQVDPDAFETKMQQFTRSVKDKDRLIFALMLRTAEQGITPGTALKCLKSVYIENEGSEPSDAQLIEFAKKLGLNILVPPNETTKLNKDLDLSYTNREWKYYKKDNDG